MVWEILNIIGPVISGHHERGNTIPADIKLLLTLRYYRQLVRFSWHVETSFTYSLNRLQVELRVSEAIARLKIIIFNSPRLICYHKLNLTSGEYVHFRTLLGRLTVRI